jgi:hypothetical protein
VGETIAARGLTPLVTLNRAAPPEAAPESRVFVPESRIGARMALAGRESRGGFREAIQELAELCAV